MIITNYILFFNRLLVTISTGLLIIRTPPLRIFELRNFPKSFIIYKKSGNFFVRFLLFTKKIRLRRAFIIYKISEAQIWALRGSIFSQKCCFCLKIPQKIFRLRRADGTLLLLFTKKIACGGLLLFTKFQNRFAFIIYTKSSKVFFWLLLFTR